MMLVVSLAVRLPHYGSLETPPSRQYPTPAEQKNVLDVLPGTCSYDERWSSNRYTHYNSRFREDVSKSCIYESYYGLCRFLSMEYENDQDNALKVEIEFIPKMRRVRQTDLVKIFKIKGDFPSQKWISDRNITPGCEIQCTYTGLRSGDEYRCYDESYELHGIEAPPDDD